MGISARCFSTISYNMIYVPLYNFKFSLFPLSIKVLINGNLASLAYALLSCVAGAKCNGLPVFTMIALWANLQDSWCRGRS